MGEALLAALWGSSLPYTPGGPPPTAGQHQTTGTTSDAVSTQTHLSAPASKVWTVGCMSWQHQCCCRVCVTAAQWCWSPQLASTAGGGGGSHSRRACH